MRRAWMCISNQFIPINRAGVRHLAFAAGARVHEQSDDETVQTYAS